METIILHGLGQLPQSWDAVIEALGTDCVCPSLPALLQGKAATYANLYAALEADLGAREAPLRLCGLSLGAVLAMDYALSHPERVHDMVLIAPQDTMPKLALSMQSVFFRMMPDAAFQDTGFGKADVIALTRSMRELRFADRVGQIACPTCVLCGEQDKANAKAAQAIAARIPGAQHDIIAGAGHVVNTDAPQALAARMQSFWAWVDANE